MSIHKFLLTVTAALITLAVPGTLMAQGASAATSGRSVHAASMQDTSSARVQGSDIVIVMHHKASPDGAGSRELTAYLAGCGMVWGELTWTNTSLKFVGHAQGATGTAASAPSKAGGKHAGVAHKPDATWTCTAYGYLNFNQGAANSNKEMGGSNGARAAAINYYLPGLHEPGGAVVSDCGNAYGGAWDCGRAA